VRRDHAEDAASRFARVAPRRVGTGEQRNRGGVRDDDGRTRRQKADREDVAEHPLLLPQEAKRVTMEAHGLHEATVGRAGRQRQHETTASTEARAATSTSSNSMHGSLPLICGVKTHEIDASRT
jgi:hypothetical protein